MAYYAQLDQNWQVQQVIVVDDSVLLLENGMQSEAQGVEFCRQLYGISTQWIQTFADGGKYKNFAAIGYTFDPVRHAFIAPQPGPNYVLDEATCAWVLPV